MRVIMGQRHRDRILEAITPGSRVLEWGSGGSTVWFADRLPAGAMLTSVEHDPAWHAQVARAIGRRENVRLLLKPAAGPLGRNATAEEEDPAPLQSFIHAVDGEKFDVILVDGYARSACMRAAADLLAPGGTLFLHDAQRPWYDQAKALFAEDGHIGSCPDYPGPHLWWASTSRTLAPGAGELPVIVSFYTKGTPYEDDARRLIASCKALGLAHEVVGVPQQGPWVAMCAFKARFVSEAYYRIGKPILWVDADAVIHRRPELLAGASADFAVHRAGGWQFNSATVFFNQTPEAEDLLARWRRRCQDEPGVWDQVHLDLAWEDAVRDRPLRTLWLPQSYAKIFDWPAEEPGEPVIEQFQASRRTKASTGDREPPQLGDESVRPARRASRPRAPEELAGAAPPGAPAPTPAPGAPAESRARRELDRLAAADLRRINFGCGDTPLPGWTNIDGGDGEWYDAPAHPDVIRLDIFEALAAIPDGAAEHVYSEHLFEHFTLEEGHELLREWFRILKPGGVLRIVCPDLEAEARLYLRQIAPADDETIDRHRLRWLGDRQRFQPGERLTRAMVLNGCMRLDGHKFIYDAQTLEQSLRLAGFDGVVREAYGRSRHEPLRGIDAHDGGETGRSWVPGMALVMEATRPAGVPAKRPVRRATPARGQAAHAAPGADRLARALASARRERDEAAQRADRLKRALVAAAAMRCAESGWNRIAIYGAGRHTATITRQPWAWHGVRVVAILDDAPKTEAIDGVPVVRPDELRGPIDAVVVSSDAFEAAIYERASARFGPLGVPVLRIYGPSWGREEPEASVRRLIERGVREPDARWLVANRDERHDATLPMLPPGRTEMHLRRYEFAASLAEGKRVLDAACGTGYGCALLTERGGAASAVGLDADPVAVAYAQRCFGPGRPIEYRVADATRTGLADGSVGLITSFETIEHVPDPDALLAEFARVLGPDGTLVLSTPNDKGLTAHHVHSFSREDLEQAVKRHFGRVEVWGQREGDEPALPGVPAGLYPLGEGSLRPEVFVLVAAQPVRRAPMSAPEALAVGR